MGTEFLEIIDVDDARMIIGELVDELYSRGSEVVEIGDAAGRVLAVDVESPIDLPPFDRASRDGYAVVAADTFGAGDENPVRLKCIETVEAGSIPSLRVMEGFCTRISTGAPVPEGADAIVMVEYTEADGDDVFIYRPAYPSQHIGARGSDIKEGEILLHSGTLLSPDKVAALSAAGISSVRVISEPSVYVISTGNELIGPSETLEPGRIFDSNSAGIAAALEEAGCSVIHGGIVRDDHHELREAISRGVEEADLVITSGGTSAGTGDVLSDVLEELGEVLIHGISMKPGKPTIVGVVSGKIVIGLPGFPVAALLVFKSLIDPFLRKLSGMKASEESVKTFKLSERFHSSKGRVQYALVRVDGGYAHPIFRDSGAIASLAQADGYIEIPKNVEILHEGEDVQVFLFE